MKLVIVESPSKAKTINKYLGRNYKVIASVGHIRDLPERSDSIDPNHEFQMLWEINDKGKKLLKTVKELSSKVEMIVLATDPDREGEAISWHINEVLKDIIMRQGIDVKRVAFNAITSAAVEQALSNPRALDDDLVHAYLARRALDRLVGFTLSPVLWRKLPGSRSAGRVQSVALRLICEREQEIKLFQPQEYWTVDTTLSVAEDSGKNVIFEARLVAHNATPIERLSIPSEEMASTYRNALLKANYILKSIDNKPIQRQPYPPFTTSSLQQAASSKLGLSPSKTMRIAQALYEGVTIGKESLGLITYTRTDSVSIVDTALQELRRTVAKHYGDGYLQSSPRMFQSKIKNAQEAHEAIRPTDFTKPPESVTQYLQDDEARLYTLIWNRTLASQMKPAQYMRKTLHIEANHDDALYALRASCQTLIFDGFLKCYQAAEQENPHVPTLPEIVVGTPLNLDDVVTAQHYTEPPARYSEASLIKRMEELGIGRPSTYASTLQTLRLRAYMVLDRKRLIPEPKGLVVTEFLKLFFKRYVEYDFTAQLEEKLDAIASKKLNWVDLLSDFWKEFQHTVEQANQLRVSEVIDALNDVFAPLIFHNNLKEHSRDQCPLCETGQLSMKLSRFGTFIGCSHYPECSYTKEFSMRAQGDHAEYPVHSMENQPTTLGIDPQSGNEIHLKKGRFGPYLQLGSDPKQAKRVSLQPPYLPETITFEDALRLLSLPLEIAQYPQTSSPIMLALGRYGPYLTCEKTTVRLPKAQAMFALSAEDAIEMIQKKMDLDRLQNRSLGFEPGTQHEIILKKGRYGMYLSCNGHNVRLAKTTDENTFSLEDALELLKRNVAKPARKPPSAKRTAARKPSTKRTSKPKT